MQKWQMIEDKINEVLDKLISNSGNLVSKRTPKGIKKGYQKTNQTLKNKIQKNTTAIRTSISEGGKNTIKKVKTFKESSSKAVKKAKEDSLSEIKEKGFFIAVIAMITPLLLKTQSWFASLKSSTILAFVSISTIGTLSGLNIYKQSQKIAKEKAAAEAELVEKVDKASSLSRRPGYHKKQERTFIVNDIILPAYFEKKKMSKLVIDFSIESSNKYIKAFFMENPHYINDVLNSNIEPISVDFPLEEEGKIIVKEKIRSELNKLLKDLNIQGEILEVNIHKVIGG